MIQKSGWGEEVNPKGESSVLNQESITCLVVSSESDPIILLL